MRARNIKPGFFQNEVLSELSPLTRILFIGLWCVADKAGRLEDRPKRIRAEVLPYDDCNADEMLSELHKSGMILRYSINGNGYIQITNFLKHQTPHVREQESELPAPEEITVKAMTKHCLGSDKHCAEHSLGNDEASPCQAQAPEINETIPVPDSPTPRKAAEIKHCAEHCLGSDKHCAEHSLGNDEASPRSPDSLIPDSLIPRVNLKPPLPPFASPSAPRDLSPPVGGDPEPMTAPGRDAEPKAADQIGNPKDLLFDLPDGLRADFIQHRKSKRAPITRTAMDGFRREAKKAGIPFAEAARISIERNWQGFNADWLVGGIPIRASPGRRNGESSEKSPGQVTWENAQRLMEKMFPEQEAAA